MFLMISSRIYALLGSVKLLPRLSVLEQSGLYMNLPFTVLKYKSAKNPENAHFASLQEWQREIRI